MGEINQTLGIYGAGHKATIGGKDYTLTPVVQRTKAEFEAWMEGEARKEIYAHQAFLQPEAFAAVVTCYVKDKAVGVYSWLGEQFCRVYPTVAGIKQLFYSLTRKAHAETLLPDDIDRLAEEDLEGMAAAVNEVLTLGKLLPSKPAKK